MLHTLTKLITIDCAFQSTKLNKPAEKNTVQKKVVRENLLIFKIKYNIIPYLNFTFNG